MDKYVFFKKYNHYLNIFLFIFLFFFIIQIPQVGNIANHDIGSVATLEFWAKNSFETSHIIQNVGPLGFLNYPSVFTGFLDEIKFIFNIFFTLTICFFLISFFKNENIILKIFFITCSLFLISGDTIFYILTSLLTFQIFIYNNKKLNYFCLLVLSILSLTKLVFFILSNFIIIFFFVSLILKNRKLEGVIYLFIYYGLFFLFWVLSGQSIENLYLFLSNIITFSSGYNEAMATFESNEMFLLGFGCLIIIFLLFINKFIYIAFQKLKIEQKIYYYIFIFIQGCITFVVWKHSFVRADQHVIVFFQFAIINFLIFLYFLNLDTRKKLFTNIYNKINFCCFLFLFLLSNIGIMSITNTLPTSLLANRFMELPIKFSYLTNIESFFSNRHKELQKQKINISLPQSRKVISNKSIGYFGMHPGIITYNNLNYYPSPAFISFNTPNQKMMRKDHEFYRNDILAPEFLIFDLKTIDKRVPGGDSSLSQLEILHRYKLVKIEKQFLIMKRKNNMMDLSKKLINSKNININEKISLNLQNPITDLFWISIDIPKSYLNKIISFFYKPPEYYIEIDFKNSPKQKFKLIPNIAKSGFLIKPFISNNFDNFIFRNQYKKNNNFSKKHLSMVKTIKIGCNKLKFLCSKIFNFKIYRIENIDKNFIEISSSKDNENIIFLNSSINNNFEYKKNNEKFLDFEVNNKLFFIKPKKYEKVSLVLKIERKKFIKNSNINIVENFKKKLKSILRLKKVKTKIKKDIKNKIVFEVLNYKGETTLKHVVAVELQKKFQKILFEVPKKEGFLLVYLNEKNISEDLKIKFSNFALSKNN